MGRHSKVNRTRFVVWKGDEIIAHGTAAEIAEQLKVMRLFPMSRSLFAGDDRNSGANPRL